MNIYLHSLGCDKNLVDSELMLGQMLREGFIITADPEEADVIVVNTCGFIKEAVEEGIDHILQMAQYKQAGSCKALIAAGCLVQRYKHDVLGEISEIDAIVDVMEFPMIAQIVKGLLEGRDTDDSDVGDAAHGDPQPPHTHGTPKAASESHGSPKAVSPTVIDIFDEEMYQNRYHTAPFHIAYIKISEGCDNSCTYCTIPSIRGKHRSRTMESILAECTRMLKLGARELVLVAQNTACWGKDLYGEPHLHKLARAITALDGLAWLRIMYVYPEHAYDKLLHEIAQNPKICSYLDMPIQHSHNAVLKRMGRSETTDNLRRLVTKTENLGLRLRTTVIVGFPGETDEEFAHLCAFLEEAKFDHLGCFRYSREENTPAAAMPGQITAHIKQRREEAVMTLQAKIVQETRKAFLGRELDCMVDGTVWEEDGLLTYSGRTEFDAYEIDGAVFFTHDSEIFSGEVVKVRITEAHGYDLKGELVSANN